MKNKLDNYLQHVRKACNPLDDHNKFLSLLEDQQVTNVSRLLNSFEKRYNVPAPLATKL